MVVVGMVVMVVDGGWLIDDGGWEKENLRVAEEFERQL